MTKIQLSLEAKGLKNVAGLFKGISDPYAVVSLVYTGEVLGHTETIKNNLNPRWTNCVTFDYEYESDMMIIISIVDDCSGKAEDIPMGTVSVNLKDIYNSTSQGKPHIEQMDTVGSLTLWAQEYGESNDKIRLQFRALAVKNIEGSLLGLGRTDPFLEIYKKLYQSADNFRWQLVYRSKAVMNHLNPLWEEFQLSIEAFCDNDLKKEIKIELWDWQSKGKHRSVGYLETNIAEIIERKAVNGNADREKAFQFTSSENATSKPVGQLVVLEAEVI